MSAFAEMFGRRSKEDDKKKKKKKKKKGDESEVKHIIIMEINAPWSRSTGKWIENRDVKN